MQGQSDRVYVNIDIPADKKVIITWDRKVGLESKIRSGNMLGTYAEVGNPDATKVKIKAPISGKVIMLEPPGTEISPLKVCVMEKCKHDVQVGKLCTFCGVQVVDSQNDSVGFVHKAFALSHEKAKEIYEDLEVKMLSSKKLFLVLDLDNTLIHAEIIKHHSHLAEKIDLGFNPEEEGLKTLEFYRDKFVVKLRPFLEEFLAALSPKYLIHIYTKGTRDYAEEILRQVDPKGIYVSQERLISRNEMGENQFKSIKKVIHDGSLALILDDRSDVWGSIKNLVYTQPYHIFEIIQGKLMIIRRADVFLYMIKDVLDVIHELFYLFFARGDRIKVYEIYHTIRRNLFAKERIAFFGLFQTEEDLKKSREYKSLRKLGAASIDLEPTKETTLIFSRLSSKIKTYPVTEVPVVSLWYIYYCEMYCTHLNPADFDLREPDTVIRVLEKSIHKSADEKNVAKDQMEDYLMKKESNKGGMQIIHDVIIRKLEDRNNEKEIARDESEEDADVLTKKVKVDVNGEIHAKEVNNIVESEEDHNIRDLNQDGGDNQEVLDKEVNLVQHYLNE